MPMLIVTARRIDLSVRAHRMMVLITALLAGLFDQPPIPERDNLINAMLEQRAALISPTYEALYMEEHLVDEWMAVVDKVEAQAKVMIQDGGLGDNLDFVVPNSNPQWN